MNNGYAVTQFYHGLPYPGGPVGPLLLCHDGHLVAAADHLERQPVSRELGAARSGKVRLGCEEDAHGAGGGAGR